jgi:hypothetical protein
MLVVHKVVAKVEVLHVATPVLTVIHVVLQGLATAHHVAHVASYN